MNETIMSPLLRFLVGAGLPLHVDVALPRHAVDLASFPGLGVHLGLRVVVLRLRCRRRRGNGPLLLPGLDEHLHERLDLGREEVALHGRHARRGVGGAEVDTENEAVGSRVL